MSVPTATKCLLWGQKVPGSQVVTSHVLRAARDLARVYCAHILNGAQLIVRRARAINKLQGKQLPVNTMCNGANILQTIAKIYLQAP